MYYTMTYMEAIEEKSLSWIRCLLELNQAILMVKFPCLGIETYKVQEMIWTFMELEKKT